MSSVPKKANKLNISLSLSLQDLRAELDKLLSYKITHPGVTNWNQKDKEGALLHAITDLIITEPDTSNR